MKVIPVDAILDGYLVIIGEAQASLFGCCKKFVPNSQQVKRTSSIIKWTLKAGGDHPCLPSTGISLKVYLVTCTAMLLSALVSFALLVGL